MNTCNCLGPYTVEIRNTQIRQIDNKSYIVYSVHIKGIKEAQRRYSEFEALRKSLLRLYPSTLIPPIPEKHSITDYAQKQIDDNTITDKRKRMLERFLQRISLHPILNKEHIVHRFMDGTYSWSDILNSPPLSTLSRDIDSFTSTLTHNLSFNTPVDNDIEFELTESKVDKTAQQASATFERSQKRIIRRLTDLSNDYSELGSAYNALSLNESGSLSLSIERVGQAIDASSINTKDMVKSLEIDFGEHAQDYTQYIYIVKDILRYRRMKQAQLQLLEESINSKKVQLRNLTRIEEEAKKLKTVMDNLPDTPDDHIERPIIVNNKPDENEEDDLDTESVEDGFSNIIKERVNEEYPADVTNYRDDHYPTYASGSILRATKNRNKKWSSPRRLLSAVGYTLQGIMDTDPEHTRRSHIEKLKETITQAEEAVVTLTEQFKEMSIHIQEDFDRLQIQKEADLRKMLLSFAKIHIYYCEQNMAYWKDIRNDVAVTLNNTK